MDAPAAGGLGPAAQSVVVQYGAQLVGGPHRVGVVGAGLGVEVDAHLVGVVGVGAPDRPGVEGERAEVGGPDDGGHLRGADLVGRAATGEGDAGRGDPFGEVLRGTLLVEELALDPVHEALEGGRPVAQGAGDAGPHSQEVLGHVPLGVTLLREVDLVRTGQPDGPSARVQLHRFARCCHVGHGRPGAHMPHIGRLRSLDGPQSIHGPAGDAAREADARQVRVPDPAWHELRGQMGRLPGDRAPGRRRGGDRQPHREAAHPLLPRAGHGGPGQPAGALCDRRRDRDRARG